VAYITGRALKNFILIKLFLLKSLGFSFKNFSLEVKDSDIKKCEYENE